MVLVGLLVGAVAVVLVVAIVEAAMVAVGRVLPKSLLRQ